MTPPPFMSPLFLLAETSCLSAARHAEAVGVDAVLHVSEDLDTLATWTANLSVPVWMSIRRLYAGTAWEAERAIALGAKGIALPKAHSPGEVDTLVRLVRQRADTLIRIETNSLLAHITTLREIPWTHLHVSETLWEADPETAEDEYSETELSLRTVPRRLTGRSFGTGTLRPHAHSLTHAERTHLTSMAAAGGTLVVLDLTHSAPPGQVASLVKSVREIWTTGADPVQSVPPNVCSSGQSFARSTA